MPDIVLDYHRKKIPIDHPPYFGENVGIKTTTPAFALEVNGDIAVTSDYNVIRSKTGSVYFGENVGYVSKAKGHSVKSSDGSTDLAYLGYDGSGYFSGKVGIGTTNITNILTVMQNSPTDPIADSWTTYSTLKTKKIEKALDELDLKKALEDFKKIPIYSWKRPKVGAKKIPSRLSAVAEAGVPEAILSYDAEGNVQGLDLLGYVGFLHAVVRAQQSAIDELRAEVNELKAKIG